MGSSQNTAAIGTGIGIDISAVIAYFVALFILLFAGLLLFRLFKVPARVLGKLVLNSLLGGAALFAVNFLLNMFSIHVAINVFSAAFVGILGIPGLITIVILNFIL